MGLDSVELLIEVEKEFNIENPNLEAEKIITIGDLHKSLLNHAPISKGNRCLSQKVFYRIRKLIKEKGVNEKVIISPLTKIEIFFKGENIKEEWNLFSKRLGLNLPKLTRSRELIKTIEIVRTLTGFLIFFFRIDF